MEAAIEQNPRESVDLVGLKVVREQSLHYQPTISTALNVVDAVRPLFKDSYREMVVVVGLDNRNRLTVAHVVSIGSPTDAPVCVGNVMKPLLLSNSVSFILVHNHPGNSLEPSVLDRDVTRRMADAGKQLDLELLDHLILNADATSYYGFRDHGLITGA